MEPNKKRLHIKELKWIKGIQDHCIKNRRFFLIVDSNPLTAFIYSEGGFYIEKKVMPAG